MYKYFVIILVLLFSVKLKAQDDFENLGEENSHTTAETFDIKGKTTSKSVAFFDKLGKPIQTQVKDISSDSIWVNQTLYDTQGRPALITLNTPVGKAFGKRSDFIKKSNGQLFTNADIGTLDTDPAAIGKQPNSLGWYYSTSNTRERLQDVTERPYSRTFYSELNPGAVLKTIGGNKVNGAWHQGYSFTMQAGNELVQKDAFNSNMYHPDNYKIQKTVVRDVHGIESVVFVDTDGKTLAAARSGNETGKVINTRKATVAISAQGYVDVHIPAGRQGLAITSANGAIYEVFDLITEKSITSGIANLPNGFYRIAVSDVDNYVANSIAISYPENYFDYSLNYYDNAGRLISSKQPLNKLETNYKYNSLGQLLHTKSPDEGEAWFKYRKDGQIRFSQNSEQKALNHFSYTNYDNRARPYESGIITSNAFSTANPDSALPSGYRDEQHFTIYDSQTIPTGVTPPSKTLDQALAALGLNTTAKATYKGSFLAGNVAITYTKPETTITWYKYDIYGRVVNIVQYINGLGTKTIDYTYDPVTSQVVQVDFQKHTSAERFIHKYTYDPDDQSLVKVETGKTPLALTENARYSYYETGALKRTVLEDGLQGIDYVYNLNGALKGINHPSLSAANDPGGDSNDVFGMNIHYYKGDYARTNTPKPVPTIATGIDQYNGNIKATTWNIKDQNGNTPASYFYKYNRNNWLEAASFNSPISEGNPNAPVSATLNKPELQSKTVSASKEVIMKPGFEAKGTSSYVFVAKIDGGVGVDPTGEYNVSGITYDANGNIQTLNRNKNTISGKTDMDKLSYTYKTDKPNQLLRVDDAVTAATGTDDIKDQNGNNYVYNSIGQLVRNISEDIHYFYNASGLVTSINKGDATLLRFYYNDKGHRVRKESFDPNTQALLYTEYYVRDAAGTAMAIYRNNQVQEYTVYGASRLGVYKNQASGVSPYSYELTDHLGNVRAVVSSVPGDTETNIKGATDYYPFGMAMPMRNKLDSYRYAYQGQEKDPETGKEAFQLRLWDARIGRWLTTDPYGQFSSPYLGMGNNPIAMTDPDGGKAKGCCNEVELPAVDLGTIKSKSTSFDFSGMPSFMRFDDNDWWLSDFDGNLADYNNQFNTNFSYSGDNGSALSQWNFQFHYKPQMDDMISGIHEATGQAADIIVESALWVAPVPKLGLATKLAGKFGRNMVGRYFIHTSRLHPRITAKTWPGIAQRDIGHRATSFFRNEILIKGKIGIKNHKTIFFNSKIGGKNFSIGINPWKRSIFHEGPGIFK